MGAKLPLPMAFCNWDPLYGKGFWVGRQGNGRNDTMIGTIKFFFLHHSYHFIIYIMLLA